MPTGTIGRVRTVFTGVAGTPGYSNLYFDASTTTAAAYQPFVADFWDSIKGKISADCKMTIQGEVAVLDASDGSIVGFGAGSDIVVQGTSGDGRLPLVSSGLVQWRTGVYEGGREIRGRTFIPYPTVADLDGAGVPNSSYISVIQAAVLGAV